MTRARILRGALAALFAFGAAACGLLVDTSGLTGGGGDAATAGDVTTSEEAGSGSDAEVDGGRAGDATSDGAGAIDAAGDTGDVDAGRLYARSVMLDRPVLYLPLGEAPGNAIADVVGPTTPTVIGTPVLGRPGAIAGDPDTAASFPSAGLDCDHVLDVSSLGFYTIEAWVKVPADIVTGSPRYLARQGDNLADGGPPTDGVGVYFTQTSITNAIHSRRAAGVSLTTDTPASTDGKFHHFVAVFNGTQILLYADGNLFGVDADDRVLGAVNGHLFIATRDATSGFLNGEIDEVAVYASALTTERIKAHYDIGVGTRTTP